MKNTVTKLNLRARLSFLIISDPANPVCTVTNNYMRILIRYSKEISFFDRE